MKHGTQSVPGEGALVDSVQPAKSKPVDYLTVEQRFRLDEACRVFEESFDFGVYLVGSVMDRPDFRDVDVRAIVADATFAKLYPTADPKNPARDTYWALSMSAFSLYLRDSTGLPVDFQVQQQTAANEEFPGKRNAIGLGHAGHLRAEANKARQTVEAFCEVADDIERHFGDEYPGRLAPLYELRDKVRGISDGSGEQK